MQAVCRIVGAGRDQFNRIAAEHREIAKILLPDRQVPRIVGVAFGTIAELMTAERILWRGGDIETVIHFDAVALHVELAQQSTDSKENAAGIVADDEEHRVGSAGFKREMITLGG